MAPARKSPDPKPSLPNGGAVRKRNRIPVSCELCRTRKLKCDRQKPCQNCKARDLQLSCSYVAQDGVRPGLGPHRIAQDMGDRINRLESLVSSLVNGPARQKQGDGSTQGADGGHGLSHSTMESSTEDSSPYGAMVVGAEGHHFVGESHWVAILSDITAIKESLEELPKQSQRSDPIDLNQPALFGGVLRSVTTEELKESLPPKYIADKLLTRFFDYADSSTPASSMVHKPTFLKRYNYYWADLDSTPLPQLGMMFSVYCIALQTYMREGDIPDDIQGYVSEVDAYRHRAAQCILASDIAAPAHDSIPCFVLYAISEYSRLPFGDISLWMMHSLLVRKAMFMGYHRDPGVFKSISPFEGEMRRRLWHSLCQLDLLLSFQLGLPSMIQYAETDVLPPTALYEEDLYEEMPALPPARPPTEPVPVWYFIAKQRLFVVFGNVVQHLNFIKLPSDSKILELNQQLCEAHAQIPPHLRYEPSDEAAQQPNVLRFQAMTLQMFYDKAICILNRRFLAGPKVDSRFEGSRSLCIKSALSLISIQHDMHRLGSKWYTFSLNRNDFLLATVIICLVLHTGRGRGKYSANRPAEDEEVLLIHALETARGIWGEIIDQIHDARRACKVIDAMLHKLSNEMEVDNSSSGFSRTEPGTYSSSVSIEGSLNEMQTQMLDWSSWDSVIQGSDLDNFETLDGLLAF